MENNNQPIDQENLGQNQQINILEVPLDNDSQVLNLMITFLNIAHKRGAFSLEETGKIWSCIEYFKNKN